MKSKDTAKLASPSEFPTLHGFPSSAFHCDLSQNGKVEVHTSVGFAQPTVSIKSHESSDPDFVDSVTRERSWQDPGMAVGA